MQTINVESAGWEGFELLDSGDGRKLERWGQTVVDRPEPKALWRKSSPKLWGKADAICDDKEKWTKPFPNQVLEEQHGIRFGLRMWQGSKHLGLFPEQHPHWQWIRQTIRPGDRLLNLFGYTGSASLVAAQAGAKVTHVDASSPAVADARSNAQLSGLEDAPIRWIVEDAMTYLKREERRGSQYDAILLDPPSFGRGPKGQLWKIDFVMELVEQCARLLSDKPRLVLLTMYNLEASALTLANLLEPFKVKGASMAIGELALKQQNSDRYLPLSLYGRASWQ